MKSLTGLHGSASAASSRARARTSRAQDGLKQLFLCGGVRSVNCQSRSAYGASSPLCIETLEPRSLMAAGISYDPTTFTLRIDGDSLADSATVTRLTQGTSSVYDDQLRVTLSTGVQTWGKPQTYTSKLFSLWPTESMLDPSQTINRITFRGFAGDDTFRNNSDIASFAEGGAGNDKLYGGSISDTLYGGGGLDTLYGFDGADVLDGGVPGVAVYADNTGDDVLYGGLGNDILHASDYGSCTLNGEEHNDVLYGWQGNDTLKGGSGNDRLSGFSGNDRLEGESGNDVYVFQPALGTEVDTIVELAGGGSDTLDFSALTASLPVTVNLLNDTRLATHTGRTVNTGSIGQQTFFENVTGGAGNDALYGNAAINILVGGPGNDGLFGAGGADTLWGNTGPAGTSVGGGADRFLVQDGDRTPDFWAGYDAQIQFVNAPAQTMPLIGFGNVSFAAGNWADGEIIQVDTALGNLHQHTGNTRLLRQALVNTNMVFQRVGSQITTTLGGSIFGWNNFNGTIALTDGTFRSSLDLWQTVYHELGHNWDSPTTNPYNAAFRQLSDWRQGATRPTTNHVASAAPGDDWWHVDTARFARSYGQWNPQEDYATTWETYFLNRYHGTTNGNTIVQPKHDNLDLLFADLGRLS